METVPGKATLHALGEDMQTEYGITLTDFRIEDEFKEAEVVEDLRELLRKLDLYRSE